MTINFTIESWHDYCFHRVEVSTHEQRERKKRLLDINNPEVTNAWESLAKDVLPLPMKEADGTWYMMGWPEALHQVIGTLLFPPEVNDPTPYVEQMRAAKALRKSLSALHWNLDEFDLSLSRYQVGKLPLLPGKSAGIDYDRNWIALYLREKVIRCFFKGPHHADIAALVRAALDIEISADQVRLLKPRNPVNP